MSEIAYSISIEFPTKAVQNRPIVICLCRHRTTFAESTGNFDADSTDGRYLRICDPPITGILPNAGLISSADVSSTIRIWATRNDLLLKDEFMVLSGKIYDLQWSPCGMRSVAS
ncbi:hypothetical protein TorRG33x02_106280, partial [Trema orientale]